VIYEFPDPAAPLRQGDIFPRMPRVDISLANLVVMGNGGETDETSWDELGREATKFTIIAGVTQVPAVIITQDCDAIRAPDVTLCEIKPFAQFFSTALPSTPKKWTRFLQQQTINNWKWFYFPASDRLGFAERMVADFLSTIRVPREELEALRTTRSGRLDATADEHFRERLSDFYRRYPYNEWYPFTREEFEAYCEGLDADEMARVEPYPYQR